MRMRLQRDIDKLKKRIVRLGAVVEERFHMAVKAIECKNAQLAQNVIDGDIDIDQAEVDVEEECLKILALHQPVADDLRYIVAVLKMNNDLERIGDLAVNIAQRAATITEDYGYQIPFDYFTMAQKTGEMLQKSLDSLVNMDLRMAYQVCAEDDDVDFMKNMMQNQFADEVRKDPENVESLIDLFLISRHLERIADHASKYCGGCDLHDQRSNSQASRTQLRNQPRTLIG